MLGFLSPDGIFYECEHYGHLSLAADLCREVYCDFDTYNEEEYLAERGWMIFTKVYAGINFYNPLNPKEFTLISDAQIEWIGTHLDELNPDQKLYLSSQLEQERIKGKRKFCEDNGWCQLNIQLNRFADDYTV